MSRFVALVCWLLALMAGVALGRPFSAIPGRTLLATFTVSDICQKPQEVAITIANSLVEGTGLTVAESEVRILLNLEKHEFFSCYQPADLSFLHFPPSLNLVLFST